MSVPTIRLNNGYDMPIIGLGTLQIPRNKARQVILQAIDSGYRHFDCAIIYNNEAEIGQGLKRKIIDGTVKRKDLFITSKVQSNSNCFPCTLAIYKQKINIKALLAARRFKN